MRGDIYRHTDRSSLAPLFRLPSFEGVTDSKVISYASPLAYFPYFEKIKKGL
jgi:hypothetical protein